MKDNNMDPRRERIRRLITNRIHSTRSRDETSDIIQGTMLQLWTDGLDDFESPDTHVDQALLSTIAKGTLAKSIRRHTAGKRDVGKEKNLIGPVKSEAPTPVDELISQEDAQRITRAMAKLPDLENRVLFRRVVVGETLVQIGRELELSRRQLMTIYKRAVTMLKKLMESE